MKVNIYTPAGTKKEEIEVSKEFTTAKASEAMKTQAVLRYLSNQRDGNAHSKNRGEVSGGGKKPFKQKGTGNARAGSTRSPLWVGGGVTFGPRNVRNYSKRMPQGMRKAVLQVALAEKIKQEKLIVVTEFGFKEIKTKQMQAFLEKLPLKEGKILLILSKTDANVELSASNLPYMKAVQVSGLTLFDVLKYDYILTDKNGLKALEEKGTQKNAK